MAAVTVMPREPDQWIARDHEWTVADLEDLPDDGLQYELFDGVLLVSPSPRPLHQLALQSIFLVLHAECPGELQVFVAPLDFQPTKWRSAQPDVLVVRREDARGKKLAGVPVLVVEVLSASTRSKDRVVKQKIYVDAGVPSFWIFDPGDLDDEATEPSVEAYELRGGAYVQVAAATGNEQVTVETPYPVTICPAEIVAG